MTQVFAGHIVTRDPFVRGASGGCIFNEADEVVGIAVWNVVSGIGVVLTKKWNW